MIFIRLGRVGTCSKDHRIQNVVDIGIIGPLFLCPTRYVLWKVESSSSKAVRVRTEAELERSHKDPERLE